MNSINFKSILINNAKKKLVQNVHQQFNILTNQSNMLEKDLSEELIKRENPILTTLNIDPSIEEVEEIRRNLTKFNYHFPDVINMGSLINEKSTPSEILKNNSFRSQIPFLVPIQKSGIAFLINNKYKERITEVMEHNVINLITSLPDGLVKLTLIDKTGSGQNLPMLSTFSEKFIEGKVLSEDIEIQEELETIKNSMGTIAQSISANGFDSIEHFNRETDEVPQRYNIIVINSFPTGFNKKSTENILSIIESGYKSGMYVFMTSSFDHIYGYNQNINGLSLNTFLKLMTTFDFSDRTHDYLTKGLIQENVEMSRSPIKREEDFKLMVNSTFKIKFSDVNKDYLKERVFYLNEKINKMNLKPIIDLEKIIPPKDQWYSKSAAKGVSVPFGKRGIENIYFSIGVNQNNEDEATHHGIIGGATGSGKTVFIHDLILMMSFLYSPEDLQFYLLDYKEGTEFATYKDFPSVTILSMDSEVEFGHDVLQKAVNQIGQRGKLFKKAGTANLFNYNNSEYVTDENQDGVKLPRIIIIIDEFQELFPKDQRISSRTNELFDIILRKGRSFGINLILATQTLKGVDLDPAILSNMPLRIALKMDEKDSIKLFGDNNNAPKYLENPGEGIYNKSYGNAKSNVSFQACRIMGDDLDRTIEMSKNYMEEVLDPKFLNDLKKSRFIYTGEVEGNISNLTPDLDSNNEIFLGEPVGLDREHIAISFKNDFAENLMIVGQDQLKASSSIFYLIDQILKKDNTAKITFNNFSLNFEKMFKNEFEKIEGERFHLGSNKDSEKTLKAFYDEYKKRKEADLRDVKKEYYIMFFIESARIMSSTSSLDKNRKMLNELLSSASEYGMHMIFYAIDFTTIRDQDLTKDLNKFNKKYILQGGSSLKVLGTDSSAKFSKNKQVAIIERGILNEEYIKFKPYIKPSFKYEIIDKNKVD